VGRRPQSGPIHVSLVGPLLGFTTLPARADQLGPQPDLHHALTIDRPLTGGPVHQRPMQRSDAHFPYRVGPTCRGAHLQQLYRAPCGSWRSGRREIWVTRVTFSVPIYDSGGGTVPSSLLSSSISWRRPKENHHCSARRGVKSPPPSTIRCSVAVSLEFCEESSPTPGKEVCGRNWKESPARWVNCSL
jgi:hypothetical protein